MYFFNQGFHLFFVTSVKKVFKCFSLKRILLLFFNNVISYNSKVLYCEGLDVIFPFTTYYISEGIFEIPVDLDPPHSVPENSDFGSDQSPSLAHVLV